MQQQPNQGINSQQLSYEQFQQQVQQQKEQERVQAQQALRNVGLDSRSQQVNQVLMELQGIQQELAIAENQLQMQMDAQKRQIQAIGQRIRQAESQVRMSMNASAASGAVPPIASTGFTQ
ncbi:hypothetical protein [Paenibacillus xanthanilyticus]|uniref:FlxA-like protein n=1 Tax=Paenibacillus xanthanilyticus TaxID=1783531 RepID=A0ABV8K564_9BACL